MHLESLQHRTQLNVTLPQVTYVEQGTGLEVQTSRCTLGKIFHVTMCNLNSVKTTPFGIVTDENEHVSGVLSRA